MVGGPRNRVNSRFSTKAPSFRKDTKEAPGSIKGAGEIPSGFNNARRRPTTTTFTDFLKSHSWDPPGWSEGVGVWLA
jgi:hypothetical protein